MRRRAFVKTGVAGGALAGMSTLDLLGDGPIRQAAAQLIGEDVVGADVRRHALVIGNGAYAHVPHLDNPPNDARIVASALRELNFHVDYLEDGNRDSLHRALENHIARVDRDEVTLLYFAGHGVQVDGINYLMPIDIRARGVDDVVGGSMSFDWCIDQTYRAGSGMAIFILDACRDNPFEGVEGAIGRGLASVSQARGETFIAYAAAAGAVAFDDSIGGTGNSPFTGALVNALELPGRDIFEVFRSVRAQVREATEGQQLPWLSTSLERSFVFRPNPKEPLPQVASASDAEIGDTERVMWDAIRESRDRQDFWVFMDLYPDSKFTAQAKAMLADIDDSQLPALPQPIVRRSLNLSDEVTECDLLAAHPNDSQRIAEGVISALVNTRLAIRECTKALAKDPDNPRLQFQLARVLNIREQWDDGEAFLIKAAQGNYAAAYAGRADLYVKGIARPKDYDLSFELFRKAAELGDVGGQLGLGQAYLEGWGTAQSIEQALFWMETAAARNFASALDRLGTLYRRGRHIEPDLKLAVFYYERAASLGSSNAMSSLARIYREGKEVEPDLKRAVELFQASIDRGNIFAPYELAKMYRRGWGVEADMDRAIELLRLSAERGFAGGWIELAQIYMAGEGVEQDHESAYFFAFIAKEIALQRSADDPTYQRAQSEIETISEQISLIERLEIDERARRWLELNGPNLRRTRDAFK